MTTAATHIKLGVDHEGNDNKNDGERKRLTTVVVQDKSPNGNSSSSTETTNRTGRQTAAATTSASPPVSPPTYLPGAGRIVTPRDLQTLGEFIRHPLWIFDMRQKSMRWANAAGLELWNAQTLDELLQRDFSDMSQATIQRMENTLLQCQAGKCVVDQWTYYPKGQAKTVVVTLSGIRLAGDAAENENENRNESNNNTNTNTDNDDNDNLPHMCVLNEGIPVEQTDLNNETLRSVEMLRHLPCSVCQFNFRGHLMYQNPEACLLEEHEHRNDDKEEGKEEQKTEEHSKDKIVDQKMIQNDDHDNEMESSPTAETTPTMASTSVSNGGEPNGCDTNGSAPPINDENEPVTTGKMRKLPCQPSSSLNHDHHICTTACSKKLRTGGSLVDRFVEKPLGRSILKQAQNLTEQTTLEFEAMVYTKDGPQWSAIRLRQSRDPVTGEDVLLYSARNKSDVQRERQAREEMAEFLAIMAHEIRTPLHQVTGFVDLLDRTPLDSEQKGFVRLLKSCSQGLMTVINDVLDYSKLEARRMKLERLPFEPLSVLKGSLEAIRTSCEERGLSLELEWDHSIPFKLVGDPNRLRQILGNLLSNAFKFTKQGGITVKTAYIHSPEGGGPLMVKFTVSDTGIGIQKENQQVIFQKYQQANIAVARNYGGTGLGLPICTLLVQMMEGKMGVESELGCGASFWFTLPANVPSQNEAFPRDDEEQATKNDEPLDKELRILVVEDNKINQKLLVKMLERMGHKTWVAGNGMEAIDMVEQNNDGFDVCLMDIQMPVCDGIEATKRLRCKGYTDLPIVALTASVARSDFVELGFDDWLPKPIRMKDLKIKLENPSAAFKQDTRPDTADSIL